MSDKRVLIFDTTLRDGEQAPGCSMNLEEKLVLARQLAKLGVDVIEAGFPIASDGDFEAVRLIAQEVRGPIICGLARSSTGDIDRAWEALRDGERTRIHTFIATSEIHMRDKLKMGPERVLEEVGRAVERARGYCEDVEFSAEDATRSDWDYLVRVYKRAIEAGATTLNVPDTVGYTMPQEFAELIRYLRQHVSSSDDVRFSVHCHDDLGLSVANSLAAIRSGARQVECTVNGIGERAGNTSMEEVAMALKTRCEYFDGCDTGIVTKEIYSSSRLLSQIIGIKVPPNKAVVGDNAFAHEAGIHQHGVLSNRLTYEIMTPESVGRGATELVLGKHSGRHALAERLRELGFDPEKIDFEKIFKRFKELADAKKTVYNEDIEALVTDQLLRVGEHYKLDNISVVCGTFVTPTATVEMSVDGEARKTAKLGDGPVDAVYKAITEITQTKSRLLRYHVNAITSGMDAQGEVAVTLEEDGVRVIGQGADTDILVASARAYIHALNKLYQRRSAGTLTSLGGI
ncbi:MAG: 2-isopropylmalate synthase [Deltaproteobacteria bacterium]|nr:MAG: 2-isopropylmalate synthase [Deltaproteobacteria bacterium]